MIPVDLIHVARPACEDALADMEPAYNANVTWSWNSFNSCC